MSDNEKKVTDAEEIKEEVVPSEDTTEEVATEDKKEEVATEDNKEEVQESVSIENKEDNKETEDDSTEKEDDSTEKEDKVTETEVETTEKEAETKEKETESKEKKDESKEKEDKPKGIARNKVTLIVIGMAVILLTILIGYVLHDSKNKSNVQQSNTNAVTETSSKVNKEVLEDALAQLKNKDTYIISTLVNAPMGMTSYIEYVTPEYSATMVDDNNIEKAYQEIDLDTADFRLNDVIQDGHLYFIYNDSTNGEEIYQAPDNYADLTANRKYMFFDWVIKDLEDIEFVENVDTDLGNGTVSLDVYKGKLNSDVVKKILGNGTVGLYQCVQESTESEGLKKLMGWLIDDIDFTLVYSDANVLVGVVDGSLAYLNFELGGLGTKMYVTKCFIENTNVVKDTKVPDFSNAVPYEELYASYGEMALDFDSLEDMYNNLYAENQSNISDEELQQMLDNAVQKASEEQGQEIETEIIHDDETTDTATEEATDTATEETTDNATEETSN